MWIVDGSLWTAGGNKWGQLGDGKNEDRLTFVKVLPSGQCDSKVMFIESVCVCVCVCQAVNVDILAGVGGCLCESESVSGFAFFVRACLGMSVYFSRVCSTPFE